MTPGPRYFGLDLTDGSRAHARQTDVAVMDENRTVDFFRIALPALAPTHESTDFRPVLDQLRYSRGDVLVLDGPQALARHGRNSRMAEAELSTPGKTPHHIDAVRACAGRVPFLGYLYYSVLLFRWLTAHPGIALLDLEGDAPATATLFEAFPGATWNNMRKGLPKKDTPEGARLRTELLDSLGFTFPKGTDSLSHDENDAALCAWLGWATRNAPNQIRAVGEPVFIDADGRLREGRILDRATTGRIRPSQM